jgi:hypothetical protein
MEATATHCIADALVHIMVGLGNGVEAIERQSHRFKPRMRTLLALSGRFLCQHPTNYSQCADSGVNVSQPEDSNAPSVEGE